MRTALQTGIAGICAGLGILFPSIWWVSCIGVAIFAYILNEHPRNTFLTGWNFGIFFCGTAIIWFWAALPFDWLGIESSAASTALLAVCWGYVAIGMGVFFGLFAMVYIRCHVSTSVSGAIVAASLWTLIQYCQMWGFAILTIGNSSLLGAHFSPPAIGYALVGFSPFLQFAALGGIYALTFCVALVGFLAYHAVRVSTTHAKATVAGTIICIAVLTYIDQATPLVDVLPQRADGTVRIALITTNIFGKDASARVTDAAKKQYMEIVRYPIIPDIIVAPENADVLGNDSVSESLVIDSIFTVTSDSKHSFLRFHNKNGLIAEYRKMLLVPQGEYVVWPTLWAIRLFTGSQADTIIANYDVTRGDAIHTVQSGRFHVGALFCSDILSPKLYRTLTSQGAEILINAASQAPFHGSRFTDQLVLSMAQVRAVESGRYFALSGNAIPSFVVSNRGSIVALSPKGKSSTVFAEVPLLSHATPYARFGELVLLIPIALCVAILWRRYYG